MKNKKKWYKKTSTWITIAILLLIILPLLIFNFTIIIKSSKNPDKIPDFMGYKPFIVLTGSMETEIYENDLVIVKDVDPNSLKVDDVIAFRTEEDKVITHRIIEITHDGNEIKFVTKGDANNVKDSDLVAYGDVEGVYLFKIAGLGRFLVFLSEPLGVAVSIMTIALLFFIGCGIFMLVKKKKKTREEIELEKEFEEFKRKKQQEK